MDCRLTFAFHAASPAGEWINDPNGLVFMDGQWRLFVQHSAISPDNRETGWARLSSPNLLTWTWDGQVIAPDHTGQAFSGSVVAGEGACLSAFLTRHIEGRQRQFVLTSKDSGATWRQDDAFGPEGRNVRDPFVFFCAATNDWRMIVAEPCDWNDWRTDPPSTLTIWRKHDAQWIFAGRIGPWMETGILWEVPVLVDFGAHQALIVSTIDQREGKAACAVSYWLGQFDGTTFVRLTNDESSLLDYGPDFYAAIVDAPQDRDDAGRKLVAWASNWATARSMPWPGEVGGGPITLPRTLSLDETRMRLVQRPVDGIAPSLTCVWDGKDAITIDLAGDDTVLSLMLDGGSLAVRRRGLGNMLDFDQRASDVFAQGEAQTIEIFNDAGLVEIFGHPAGITITAFVPGARL